MPLAYGRSEPLLWNEQQGPQECHAVVDLSMHACRWKCNRLIHGLAPIIMYDSKCATGLV